MKKILSLVSLSSILSIACQDSPSKEQRPETSKMSQTQSLSPTNGPFIPIDTANIMIKSYLNSINYANNDSDLRSLIVDAEALRQYLGMDSGRRMQKVKIMFAHTMEYIDSGGLNQHAGYQFGKLTLVIAGYDSSGNYIYFPGERVMNRFTPCPHLCPEAGSAAVDTFAIRQL